MEEVLSAGYVHLDAGTPEELYVWPYFFGIPLDRLDARQHVELFKIVTAGDYEDMKNFGSYIFYRLGITPDGRWAFFVAGNSSPPPQVSPYLNSYAVGGYPRAATAAAHSLARSRDGYSQAGPE